MNNPVAPSESNSADVFTVGDWCVDKSANRIIRDGNTVRLEPQAMAVLVLLSEHAGQVVNRESLERGVWGDRVVGYDALNITIRKLRKAFDDDTKQPRFIETIPKVGYRLIAEVGRERSEHASGTTASVRTPLARVFSRPGIAITAVVLGALVGVSTWLFIDQSQGERAWVADKSLPTKPSIAVMPFENLSSDPEQDYFVDGMTDDLTTNLSKFSGLFVISRNSSFTYKGKSVSARQVARELGVQYMLEGSVRRSGDKVRINAQLIDALADRHLWAQTYDGSTSDVFAVQDAVVGKIVAALAVNLAGEESENGGETDVPEAYDAMLLAREHFRRRTPEGLAREIAYLKKAIELDADYGEAYARLAGAYWRMHDLGLAKKLGYSWKRPRELAREYLAKALERPTSDAHAVSAYMLSQTGRHDDALDAIDRAIALQPNNAERYATRAYLLNASGEAEEAERSIRLAMRLNPNYRASYLRALGRAQLHQNHYEQAAKTLERAVNRLPHYPYAYDWLAATYGHLNRIDDAKEAVERYNETRQAIKLPPMTVAQRRDWYRNNYNYNEQYLSQFVEGLRQAGVPEGAE